MYSICRLESCSSKASEKKKRLSSPYFVHAGRCRNVASNLGMKNIPCSGSGARMFNVRRLRLSQPTAYCILLCYLLFPIKSRSIIPYWRIFFLFCKLGLTLTGIICI
ncbi:hypothetical protein F5Y17DRAFT_449367 [Xylariaceae sp. FL0594]|nr:hypothetical protein F5Y17DRAFT_449367 [Xylariaceae sp. FL0594]